MQLGFIGLGTMGASMAANLQTAGHSLVVHDIRRANAAQHLGAGACWAETPRQVAQAADVIFTSLPGPPEVESVTLGEEGLLAGMRKDAVLFDLSTNSPALVRRMHAVFAERGAHMLDAPVSGGPRGAKTRKLALWVGGERAVFDRHKALLDAIGDQARYVGPIGAGTVAKLAHNCASFAVQAALAEIFTLGVKAGVDPLDLFKAVRQGASGRKRTFDRMAEVFLPGKFDPPLFTLRLAHKDMKLALELAEREHVPMQIAKTAMASMSEAMGRGWEGRDFRVFLTLQEERAGITCRVPEKKLRAVKD